MSKTTTIICDACGASQTGRGYTTLWGRLKKQGWLSDNTRNRHVCRQCVARDRRYHEPMEQISRRASA